MSTQTTLAAIRPQQEKIETMPTVSVGFNDLQGFELAQRGAKLLSSSTLVPKEYQGNLANCVIALNMAARVGADPLMVMQNLVIVHGRPTWSAQFMISTVNSCGRFSAIRYEFFGETNTDSWGCRAWAVEKATGEKLVGTDVTLAMAKSEGWYGKNGSKWKTMPQQMLMYRAASWWARAYAPELSMGLHTAEEVRDVWDAEKQDDGTFAVNMETLRSEAPAAEMPHDPVTGEIYGEVAAENAQAAASDVAEKQEPLLSDAVAALEATVQKAVENPISTEQPALIPARAVPGDATKMDWDSWVTEWERVVAVMTNVPALEKLHKLNESILGNMAKMNPPKHTWCIELFTARRARLKGDVA